MHADWPRGLADLPMRKRDQKPAALPSGDSAHDEATRAALKLLSTRARSSRELGTLLERKGFSGSARAAAIKAVKGWGYLDDDRYAIDRASVLLREGKFGPAAVLVRLKAKGISEDRAEAAVAKATEALEFDPRTAALELLRRRHLEAPKTAAEKGKASRLLRSKGFDDDIIETLVGAETE
jgi:regulatory protein